MRKADLSELDMIGRELYARRMRELTLFGAMSDEQAHEWAMRYALGKSAPAAPMPAQADHFHYPDDYPLPPSAGI